MTKGYEDATAFLGEWRRFQQMIFFLLTAAMVPNGLIVFGVVFVADIPEHRCLVPEVNLSQEWRDAIIPPEVTQGPQVTTAVVVLDGHIRCDFNFVHVHGFDLGFWSPRKSAHFQFVIHQVVNGKTVQSSCSRYQLDLVRNFSAQGLLPNRDVNLTALQQESCLDGWRYSKDIYQSTLVTQVSS